MKKISIILMVLLSYHSSFSYGGAIETVYWDFDDMPVTSENEIPGESADWIYSSVDTDNGRTFFGSAGFLNKNSYPGPLEHEAVSIYASGYNSPHMGYWSFGYLDIINNFCMSGNCLRYTITGGFSKSLDGGNNCGTYGETGEPCEQYGYVYRTKEQYIALTDAGTDVIYDKSKGDYNIGRMKVYIGNNSMNESPPTPMPITTAAHNRMSYYVYNPEGIDPRNYPRYGVTAGDTAYPAPFTNDGGHYYHYGCATIGGGWTHYYIDQHPTYNNGWDTASKYPLPYGGNTNMPNYWRDTNTMYFSNGPAANQPIEWNGATRTWPSIFVLDNIKFVEDQEPQNEETINGMALTYVYNTTSFWLGFASKYNLGTNVDYGTYEFRYRIGEEITNANWSTSSHVDLVTVPEFSNTIINDNILTKPYSTAIEIVARFRVKPTDQAALIPGAVIWVAIKDVSQDPNNDRIPNPATGFEGRDYNTHTDLDYTNDSAAMPFIKRIPYVLGPEAPQINGPIRSAGSPTGEQPAGTTQVTMSLTTDVNATCRYNADGVSGVAYASMANTMPGGGTTSHAATITGLSNGGSYSRAIRCAKTSDGEVNTDDYLINWSVAAGEQTVYSLGAFSGTGSWQ